MEEMASRLNVSQNDIFVMYIVYSTQQSPVLWIFKKFTNHTYVLIKHKRGIFYIFETGMDVTNMALRQKMCLN